MYPISPAFQKVLDSRTGRNRTIVWWGTLTLASGAVYDLTTDTLMQGSGQLTTTCDLPCIGGAYSTELQAQVVLPIEPRTLKKAEIKLYVRLTSLPGVTTWADAEEYTWADLQSALWGETSKGIYTDIPMGVFIVNDAKRAINSIRIEAYDNILKLETDLPQMDTVARTPFEWMRWSCSQCGIELGMTKNEVRALVNGSRKFTYADINENIKTHRALLSQLAAALCCIVVCDRLGRLVLRPFTSNAVAEITPDNRFSSEYADVQSYYTGILAQYKAKAVQEYYKNCSTLDDDGLIIDLSSNVFLQISNDSNRAIAIQSIIDAFKGVTFTPYYASIPFNPAYDLMDVLAFSGGHAPKNSCGPITSIVRRIGGAMTVQCATPEPLPNATRETIQIAGVSGEASSAGTMYASSDFWLMACSFPKTETVIETEMATTELTVKCTVDNTIMQIAWTGTYTLDESGIVVAQVYADDELIYEVAEAQAAGIHTLNVTTGHTVTTPGDHTVKVQLSFTAGDVGESGEFYQAAEEVAF